MTDILDAKILDANIAFPPQPKPRAQPKSRRRFALPAGVNVLVAGAALLALILVLLALFAPALAPFEPDQQKLLARLRPPIGFERANPAHWFGTDQLGRDLLSRCLHGLRLTLALALFGTLIGLALGVSLGLVAGLFGGWADALIMGFVDIMLSLPFTLVALLVIALAGTDVTVLICVLGIAYWAHFARLVRAQVLGLRELPFVEAARAAGATRWYIATVHMIPNIVSPIVVMASLNFSNLILLESALSFLGLGVQPPTATLGSMVGQGRDYMASASWIVAVPALLIVLVSLAAMLLGDFLRDHLDVRLRER
ncbi:peptide/nickel transport system permease protein [Bosea sp. OK403]|uniref:ABC transporter permease n=1 Tax=Bosea sp. OK403 TaxID=1855286 RepID=UPI0008E085D8|nr:ABC transporter permease [Bosea sp. OK403]SFJ62650.1 peptide/nickel transport system permease protein [Bosea sp. OK403]